MSKLLLIDGLSCKVIENLGYQGGRYAKVVRLPGDTEKVAVSDTRSGPWRFWDVADRIMGEMEVTDMTNGQCHEFCPFWQAEQMPCQWCGEDNECRKPEAGEIERELILRRRQLAEIAQ